MPKAPEPTAGLNMKEEVSHREKRMGNNEYARRKYSLGEGAKRRKRGPPRGAEEGRVAQNENPTGGYLGWTPVSSHVPSASPFPLLAAPAVFLFDKRIHLRAIFAASADCTKHRFRPGRNNDAGSDASALLRWEEGAERLLWERGAGYTWTRYESRWPTGGMLAVIEVVVWELIATRDELERS
ncbi:hypothetical protein KM043_003577 [Ampulex compressa]|nr:hypothetical protein KM043_003577 [Ampulex compressa]